jgi:tRNA dimethylallyltransferase
MPSETSDSRPPLVMLVGATAVGKTRLALALAGQLPLEIISADSRLLYRGMDIGTAKPSPAEQASVPHHLIDVTDIDKPWSLAEYLESARRIFSEVAGRGRLPVLVGGTGQYVRALREGWQIPPTAPNTTLRDILFDRAAKEGGETLFGELIALDPEAAAFIDPRNVRRVIRALEVVHTTGEPFSQQRRKAPLPFRILVLGLRMHRVALYAQADLRIEAMLNAGWVEEVRGLLEKGYAPTLPPFSALGYREVIRYLRGELPRAECFDAIRYATHGFIRHQVIWFREEDASIHWLDASGGRLLQSSMERIQTFMG